MVRLPDFNPIEFLVARKFPDVLAVLSGAGPPSLRPRATPSPKYREKRRQEIADYKATLRAMPPDALQALLESETKKSDEEERATIDPEEKARFYNQPYANADFNHWSRAAHWTLDEAVALSLGKNPEVTRVPTLTEQIQLVRGVIDGHLQRDVRKQL
jgi:hypothetical protein